MDELLKEFWAAWKRWDRIRTDIRTYPCGWESTGERHRAAYRVNKIADRIRAAEHAAASKLPAGAHEDIPGQMYLTDLPVGSLTGDASQRGAA